MEHSRIAGRAAKKFEAAGDAEHVAFRVTRLAEAYLLMRLAYEKATDQVAEGE